MQIAEAMSRDVQVLSPSQTIVDAAKMMADYDCGVLPIEENDQLIGIITDRDIVVRALAQGKMSDARVKDVMSPEIKYCFEDDDVSDVARNMSDLQIRRLPVVNRNKRLVGIVSLGDIAVNERGAATEALHGISKPAS